MYYIIKYFNMLSFKKIILSFILLFFLSVSGYGQFVNVLINQGSATTLNGVKGGWRADSATILSPIIFTDTASANFSVCSKYSGSLIQVASNSVWVRSLLPYPHWIELTNTTTGTGTVTSLSQGYGIILSPNPIITSGTAKTDTTVIVGKPYFSNIAVKYWDTALLVSGYALTNLQNVISNSTLNLGSGGLVRVDTIYSNSNLGVNKDITIKNNQGLFLRKAGGGVSVNALTMSPQDSMLINPAANPLVITGSVTKFATNGQRQELPTDKSGIIALTSDITGSVSTVSVVSANGISGTVANPTTTPAITLSLNNITPTSVNSSGAITGTTLGGTLTTAAQPNVTSVGTLSNLTVSGIISQSVLSSILYGNSIGTVSAVLVGSGLSFSSGTLSATAVSSPFTQTGTIITTLTPSATISTTSAASFTTITATSVTASANITVTGTVTAGSFTTSGSVTGDNFRFRNSTNDNAWDARAEPVSSNIWSLTNRKSSGGSASYRAIIANSDDSSVNIGGVLTGLNGNGATLRASYSSVNISVPLNVTGAATSLTVSGTVQATTVTTTSFDNYATNINGSIPQLGKATRKYVDSLFGISGTEFWQKIGINISPLVTADVLTVTGASTTTAIAGTSNAGIGLQGNATSGIGVNAISTSGNALDAENNAAISAAIYSKNAGSGPIAHFANNTTTQLIIQNNGVALYNTNKGSLFTNPFSLVDKNYVDSVKTNLATLSATDATLTFSGNYNGSVARIVGLNLSNANTWSAGQTFSSGITMNGASSKINITGLNAYSTGSFLPIARNSSTGFVESISASDLNTFLGITGTYLPLSGGTMTGSIMGRSGTLLTQTSSGTSLSLIDLTNTGTDLFIGIENSSGGALFTGSTAYMGVLGTTAAKDFGLGTNDIIRMKLDGTTGAATFSAQIGLAAYTVAGLPSGTIGQIAYVTDALTPSFLVIVVGGGSTKTPVFYNGTNWVVF